MRSARGAAAAPDPRAWAVVAGGGTAGHVLPGLSVCEEIVRRGTPVGAVHWVGSARGVESRLVPEAGFSLTALSGRGLQRRLLATANFAAATGLLLAFLRSWTLLKRLQPAVVVGLGGYASIACGMAAAVRRIPLIVMEQNAVAGAANRLLSRFAECAAVAFDTTELREARFVGNPMRPEILAVDRVEGRSRARAALGVAPGRRLVAVFGGSLGARSINDAVSQAVSGTGATASWKSRCDLHVRHISGRRDHVIAQASMSSPQERCDVEYDLVEYEDDMASLYTAADVVVCRAGATTVAELAATGTPSVLVPLPGAPRDHQTANAQALVSGGAAVMVPDRQLTGSRLIAEVDALLADQGKLDAMARAAAASARPDAARSVVDLMQRHARRPRPSTAHGAS